MFTYSPFALAERGAQTFSRGRRVLRWIVVCTVAGALRAAIPTEDFTQLSLEELGALSISAAAKHAEPLFQTPAAVSVLLSSDILRAGDGSISDALRLIPGVHVAAINASKNYIAVRGFNGVSSTKLLVIVDGRNIYSPYYGGVDWAEADLPVEDIEHVEVVRGPGATLWGVNAVNGIVSITSKPASDTQGGLVSVRDGTGEGLAATVRYGGILGSHTWYRIYGHAVDSDRSLDRRDGPNDVGFHQLRTGFRVDDQRSDLLRFTWQADYLFQQSRPKVFDPRVGAYRNSINDHDRTSLLGRLNWRGVDDHELTAQLYVDRSKDKSSGYQGLAGNAFALAESGTNVDLDVSDHRKLGERHDLVWGGGLRGTTFNLGVGAGIQIRRPAGTDWRYNFFAQDEVTLVPERVKLTLGSKLEHHDSVGWQALPSARIAFTPSAQQTWWAAISRAVRAPSRSERDVRLPFMQIPGSSLSPPVEVDLVSTEATREEVLVAYEVGWRYRPHPRFTIDATAYRHDYSQLRNLASSTRLQYVPLLVLNDLTEVSNLRAVGYGLEVEATWRVTDGWRLGAGFTDERLNPRGTPVTPLIDGDFALPNTMGNLRTWFALPHDFELSAECFSVSRLSRTATPGYCRCDAQLTWRPRPELELNIGVQNAFDSAHLEYGTPTTYPVAEARRNVFGRVQWRF